MICKLCLRYDGGDCEDFYIPMAEGDCEAFIPKESTSKAEGVMESLERAVISEDPVAVKLINEWVAHIIKESAHYSGHQSQKKISKKPTISATECKNGNYTDTSKGA